MDELDPCAAAIKAYLAAGEEADREMEAAIQAAHAKRDQVEEDARAACQAVLDANTRGVKITVGRVRTDAEHG